MLFKNVVYDQYLRYFKIELYSFTKNFFPKTFVQYVTVWVVRRWTYKKRMKKRILFHGEQNRKKTDKNGYCVNPSSQIKSEISDINMKFPTYYVRQNTI